MNYHLNTYEACSQHIDGNQPTCLLCEIDTLRELLREVANSHAFREEDIEPAAMIVRIKADLWTKILPLRQSDASR